MIQGTVIDLKIVRYLVTFGARSTAVSGAPTSKFNFRNVISG